MKELRSFCGRWLREPLVHFLAIGALIFAASVWLSAGRASSDRIVVTPGQVDVLIATFTRTWQRPPNEQELKAQLDDFVREEIATREAMAGGLDRDDAVIRRRLRQKLEALVVDLMFDPAEVTDAELQAWLDSHAGKFQREPQVAFRQVYLNAGKRGATAADDAGALRQQLVTAGPDANIERLGDPLMVPGEVPLSGASDIARVFGEDFARQAMKLEPGRWEGPIRSSYGLHIVFVREREPSRAPTLAEVRPQVERLFSAERRQRRIEEMYGTLLEKYQVVVEPRPQSEPKSAP
ncbi:peptidyl-prolyl cis-trans isomerase [Bradyrhizobium ivorense]|uniref:peptidylprolyl isomerase n=1 Tax=Bradyrhizobium ivorense TaxID=2511166 RepID=UPI0010B84F78|nr:peptidylprolyl isomerase [Bradyrhizobium ivorense]VIO80976.1 hypothetical protein CI41S_76240 [Bradyrhizobium ivorense]